MIGINPEPERNPGVLVPHPPAAAGALLVAAASSSGSSASLSIEDLSMVEGLVDDGQRLTWFVREAWPSPVTGTGCTDGALAAGESICVSVESDRLVAVGDGIESDSITLAWGQRINVGLAARTLRLVR